MTNTHAFPVFFHRSTDSLPAASRTCLLRYTSLFSASATDLEANRIPLRITRLNDLMARCAGQRARYNITMASSSHIRTDNPGEPGKMMKKSVDDMIPSFRILLLFERIRAKRICFFSLLLVLPVALYAIYMPLSVYIYPCQKNPVQQMLWSCEYRKHGGHINGCRKTCNACKERRFRKL